LDALGEKDPLFLFKKGMLHLVRDEFDQCANALRAGIELNTLNEDLNADMQRVLQDVELVIKQKSSEKDEKSDEDACEGQRMLLSLYETQEDDEI
jgi:hypothetical protein